MNVFTSNLCIYYLEIITNLQNVFYIYNLNTFNHEFSI